jgi:hypothetical protein
VASRTGVLSCGPRGGGRRSTSCHRRTAREPVRRSAGRGPGGSGTTGGQGAGAAGGGFRTPRRRRLAPARGARRHSPIGPRELAGVGPRIGQRAVGREIVDDTDRRLVPRPAVPAGRSPRRRRSALGRRRRRAMAGCHGEDRSDQTGDERLHGPAGRQRSVRSTGHDGVDLEGHADDQP